MVPRGERGRGKHGAMEGVADAQRGGERGIAMSAIRGRGGCGASGTHGTDGPGREHDAPGGRSPGDHAAPAAAGRPHSSAGAATVGSGTRRQRFREVPGGVGRVLRAGRKATPGGGRSKSIPGAPCSILRDCAPPARKATRPLCMPLLFPGVPWPIRWRERPRSGESSAAADTTGEGQETNRGICPGGRPRWSAGGQISGGEMGFGWPGELGAAGGRVSLGWRAAG